MIPERTHSVLASAGTTLVLIAALGSTARATPSPQSTPLIGSAATQGDANRLAINGRYAYVATEYYGMEIFSITTPSSPIAKGSVTTPGGSYDIAVGSAGYVYLADIQSGVQIIDVSNVNAPFVAGNISFPLLGSVVGVETAGGRLYTFAEGDGMRIFDIGSNPTNPPQLGSYAPFGNVYHNDGVANGNLIYVADGVHGATVLDVTNPASIAFVSQAPSGVAIHVARLGNRLVTIAPTGGAGSYIQTFDITSPVPNPLTQLDAENIGAFSLSVAAAVESSGGSFAYTASTTGLRIWSMDSAGALTLQETIVPAYAPRGVTYYRGLLLVCEGPGGFEIYQR